MSRAVRALYVAADPDEGGAMAEAIEATASGIETRVVTSPAAALDAVREDAIDCVVARSGVGDGSEHSLLEQLERENGAIPVIVASSEAAVAREALADGASDCVRLDAWNEPASILARRIEAVVGRADDGTRAGRTSAEPAAVPDETDLERFESIIEGVGDILYALDAAGSYTYINPAGARITGYDVEELMAGGPELIFDEDDLASFESEIEALLRDEERTAGRVEATIETANGEAVPVETTLTVRYDDDGSFAGSLGVARDMTERKARERELREYETIVSALPDEVAILDTDGYITRFIPPAGAEQGTIGFRPEDLEGEHVSSFMTEESLERGVELLEELVTTDRDRAVFEIEVSGKDGETHVMEDHLALLEDEDGSIQGSVGVLRNIEDRKAHERELERYARLIEASGDAVYALDDDGRFTFSNDAHQEMVDRPKSEILGAHASIALSEKAFREGEALIRELLESDRRQGTFEMDVIRPDGTRIPTENHLALLTEDDGEFRGTVGVLRDISERQAREAELRRQNERLERFAEIASHDLRNPLNVAQGYLEMLRKGVDSEHAERIGDALDRMERLIDDTLTMARQGVTVDEPTAVELGALARESWEAVADDAGSLEVGEDVTLMADESRLRQVLENLLRNAIEHGGEDVTVRIGAIDHEGFYVEDDGPGIDPDQRDAVFEAGHTTSATGTGFGLAIVSEVVNAHGWSIAVTESDGGGARFEITDVDVEP